MPLKSCYGQDSEELFTTAADNWRLEGWLAQLGWIGALAHEGGHISARLQIVFRCGERAALETAQGDICEIWRRFGAVRTGIALF